MWFGGEMTSYQGLGGYLNYLSQAPRMCFLDEHCFAIEACLARQKCRLFDTLNRQAIDGVFLPFILFLLEVSVRRTGNQPGQYIN